MTKKETHSEEDTKHREKEEKNDNKKNTHPREESRTTNEDLDKEDKLTEQITALEQEYGGDPFSEITHVEQRRPIKNFFNLENEVLDLQDTTQKEKEPLKQTEKDFKSKSPKDPLDLLIRPSNSFFDSSNNNLFDFVFNALEDQDFKQPFSFGPQFRKSYKRNYYSSDSRSNNITSSSIDYNDKGEVFISFSLEPLIKYYRIKPQVVPKFFGTLTRIDDTLLNLELTIDFNKKEVIQNITFQDIKRHKSTFSSSLSSMSYSYSQNKKVVKLKIVLNKDDNQELNLK